MRRNKLIVGIGLLLIGVFALYGFANAEMTFVEAWTSWNGDGFTYPYDVAVDSEDYVYVTELNDLYTFYDDRILKFTSDGEHDKTWSGFSSPEGVTVDETYIYVTDFMESQARLHRIKRSDDTVEIWDIPGVPSDIAVDSGIVYVANNSPSVDCIQKIVFETGGTIDIDELWADVLTDPADIAFGLDGSVYVAEGDSQMVRKFDGVTWDSWPIPIPEGGVLPYASGIMVDSEDNIHVVDSNNGRIVKFSSEGIRDETCWESVNTTVGFDKPRGITVDSQGYVYVADKNKHRIVVFAPFCRDPVVVLGELIAQVAALNEQKDINNSLDAKLQNALDSLNAANANQRQDAANKLGAFINAVEAQTGEGKPLTEEDADPLIEAANFIISCLEQGA